MNTFLQSYPSHLGDIPHPDGSVDRYIGRPDGVYVQTIPADPTGLTTETPYEPWSTWPKSVAAQRLADPVRLPAREFKAVVSRVRQRRGAYRNVVPAQLMDDLLAACDTMQEALDTLRAQVERQNGGAS